MKKQVLYALLFLMLFSYSCTTTKKAVKMPKEPTEYRFNKAQTVVSQNYEYSKEQKIVVMPFVAAKDNMITYDPTATDMFMAKIMELGLYTIIDKGLVSSFYQKHGLQENNALGKEQLEALKKELNVDLIFYGTVDYYYKPGFERSDSTSYKSVEGHYSLSGESIKAVSTSTGEVVMMSYIATEPHCGSMSHEMVYSIKKKLAPIVLTYKE